MRHAALFAAMIIMAVFIKIKDNEHSYITFPLFRPAAY